MIVVMTARLRAGMRARATLRYYGFFYKMSRRYVRTALSVQWNGFHARGCEIAGVAGTML